MEESFQEILDSREEREAHQRQLMDKYQACLIGFKLNIPGLKKDCYMYREIHKAGIEAIENSLKDVYEFIYRETRITRTGGEYFLIVESRGKSIKKLMAKLENEHPLGRIFDIDVFIEPYRQLSREDYNLPKRKCLLCNKEARSCIREGNHTISELVGKIGRDYLDYINRDRN